MIAPNTFFYLSLIYNFDGYETRYCVLFIISKHSSLQEKSYHHFMYLYCLPPLSLSLSVSLSLSLCLSVSLSLSFSLPISLCHLVFHLTSFHPLHQGGRQSCEVRCSSRRKALGFNLPISQVSLQLS